MTRTRLRRFGRAVLTTVFATGLLAGDVGGATAEETAYVGWAELLPGLASGYEPTSAELCRSGHPRCVDAVIREMERRFRPLADRCDHDAVFAMTYLRTTEKYREATQDPTFFTDAAFLNHQDAVFADYYFRAFDAWHRGDRSQVPPAWAIAFSAADEGQVSGLGNILLGMGGHVNHDLPLVLAEIGLVKPDGSSRKEDHDRVDRFLQQLVGPLLDEVAQRFDPTVRREALTGTTLDETATFQLLALWREEAWRNAELLVAAPTPQARSMLEATLAEEAAVKSRLIVEGTRYRPLLSSSEVRDAHCAQQG